MTKTSPSEMAATVSGAGSFRSSWQSLLASMSTSQNVPGESDHGAKSAGSVLTAATQPTKIKAEAGKAVRVIPQPGTDVAGKQARVHREAEPVTEKRETENSKISKSQKPGSGSLTAQEIPLAGTVALVSPLSILVDPATLASAALKQDVPTISADDLADRAGQSILPHSKLTQMQGKETATGEAVAASAAPNRSAIIAKTEVVNSGNSGDDLTPTRHLSAMDPDSEKTGRASGGQTVGDTAPQENVPGRIAQSAPRAIPLVSNQASSSMPEGENAAGDEESSSFGPPQTRIAGAHSVFQAPAPIQSQLPGRESQAAAAPESSFGMNRWPVNSSVEIAHTAQLFSTAQTVGKQGAVTGVRTSGHTNSVASAVSNSIHLVQQGSPLSGEPPATGSFDESRLVRTPGGNSSTGNAVGAITEASAGSITEGSHETFAALDAESGTGSPAWVHAGAHRAEAGFQDPALGWVGVRAEVGETGVHAALLPGSLGAAESLGGHLAGLNSYLAEHHVQVETLTVNAPENHAPGSGLDNAAGQNMEHEAGRGAGQERESGNGSSAPPRVEANAGQQAGSEVPDRTIEAAAAPTVSGNMHISVIA
jgi:hypothetical protein